MSAGKVILLLGRRDEPTDGVLDYCQYLREAALARGFSFELAQVHWAEKGWRKALAELRDAASAWRNCWVLLQYTTLAWSRRGFPLRTPRVLDVIRQCGARPGVVFHDFGPFPGSGIVGTAREYCHLRVLRQLYARSEMAIFTVLLNKVLWLPQHREKATFIPVGANCPEAASTAGDESSKIKSVAVYGVSEGQRLLAEVADIGAALKQASQSAGPIRLLLFGRGSQEAEPRSDPNWQARKWRSNLSDYFRRNRSAKLWPEPTCCFPFADRFRPGGATRSPGSLADCPLSAIRGRKRDGQSRMREFSRSLWATAKRSRERWRTCYRTSHFAGSSPSEADRPTKNTFRGPQLSNALPQNCSCGTKHRTYARHWKTKPLREFERRGCAAK